MPTVPMAESFFASLECELLDRSTFRTKTEARLAVFTWIEGWYNPRRRHSALGYLSPMNYEKKPHHSVHSASPDPGSATAPLASGRREARGGTVDNPTPEEAQPACKPSANLSTR